MVYSSLSCTVTLQHAHKLLYRRNVIGSGHSVNVVVDNANGSTDRKYELSALTLRREVGGGGGVEGGRKGGRREIQIISPSAGYIVGR